MEIIRYSDGVLVEVSSESEDDAYGMGEGLRNSSSASSPDEISVEFGVELEKLVRRADHRAGQGKGPVEGHGEMDQGGMSRVRLLCGLPLRRAIRIL
jgi:hypothetical protein